MYHVLKINMQKLNLAVKVELAGYTSCLKAFRHLLVEYIERQKSLLKKFKKGFVSKSEKARAGKYN